MPVMMQQIGGYAKLFGDFLDRHVVVTPEPLDERKMGFDAGIVLRCACLPGYTGVVCGEEFCDVGLSRHSQTMNPWMRITARLSAMVDFRKMQTLRVTADKDGPSGRGVKEIDMMAFLLWCGGNLHASTAAVKIIRIS
jgi:hypothetical protein